MYPLGFSDNSANINNNNNNSNNSAQPHRARLVQIPNKLEDALMFNRSFENNNNNNNMPLLSTSQLKFPRKSSLRSTSPPNSTPPPPPPPLPPNNNNGTYIPISRSFIGNNSIPTTYIKTSMSDKSINEIINNNNKPSLMIFFCLVFVIFLCLCVLCIIEK